ncbi:MAG: 16S rRNA (cytidine(1402)-2'-O)-methyltransferase [Chromatiales bacterium]|nr:16S rRNA (cytidine(1402)-2'-O)-methyltransferase [Chromatiales bacterium]
MSIESGVLYVVATPIGNLGDLTPRAEQILKSVALIAAEDTRHSKPLLHHFGITTPMLAYHEHNERQVMDKLLQRLREGDDIALISDAGTPLISDPGFPLVRACREQGVRVSPVPGVSAAITALSVAGLPTDRFVFEGFPARTQAARLKQFEALQDEQRTIVFYESSHRVLVSLQDIAQAFGADRLVVLARELTKTYETVLVDPVGKLIEQVRQDSMQQKGEFVLLIAGYSRTQEDGLEPQVERVMRILLAEMPVKQAAAIAAKLTGEKKNKLYQQALVWQKESS